MKQLPQLLKPSQLAKTACGVLLGVAVPLVSARVGRSQLPATPIFDGVTIAPQFSPDPITLRGISGGSIAVEEVVGVKETNTGFCLGYVDRQPDHRLVLTNPFSYLSLQVLSPQDTMLVVRGPGGTWCNDDFNGKNPGIAGEWLPGAYEVWVGSYRETEYHPYIINITEVQ